VKWPEVSLGDALTSADVFVDGDWVESKDQDPQGDIRLIQLADIGDGTYLDKSERFLTASKARELRCTLLKTGDVLVARMPDPLGRACIYPGDPKAAVTVVDVCVIRPNEAGPDARWLVHWFNSASTRNQIAAFATGTTRSRISRGNLSKLRLRLPPIAEQRRIAEILDKADAVRAKRRTALAQLDTLTQSIFLHMFGDRAAILKRWAVSELGHYLKFLTSGSRGWAEHYTDNGDVFLRIQNVRKDELIIDDITRVKPPQTAEATRTRVLPGDVLLSITADLGRTAVVPHGFPHAFINQHLAILRLAGVEPRFVSAFLSSPAGRLQVQSRNRQGVKAGLNFDDIRSFLIPVPPLELQDAFARAASSVDALKIKARQAERTTTRLFSSLQHRAFRGQNDGAT
jgi:type I restriction enzyme S subunit